MQDALVLQVDRDCEADRSLIGGKAASLVSLARQGARVPPAFVLTTAAYRQWAAGAGDQLIDALLAEGLTQLEARTARRFGAASGGLIVSVRSGAPISMPGRMDTLLNVGIGSLPDDAEAFMCEARARFLCQYAELVMGLDTRRIEALNVGAHPARGPGDVNELERLLRALADGQGKPWPRSVREELTGAARAVFQSWQSTRARLYRSMRKIDDALGTTVAVQQMVFGNRGSHSGSGVAFTRDPTDGSPGLHGDFLFGGQGEDVVAGREAGQALTAWRSAQSEPYAELTNLGHHLEAATGKVHEIEFTVEQGQLWVLQCRAALLTARAAARVAVEFIEEGRMDRAAAIRYAQEHGFNANDDPFGLVIRGGAVPLGRGLPIGGGVAVGVLAFDSASADTFIRAGRPVVFVAVETAPSLLSIMRRAAALVTMRGGTGSHAAVVARELGKPCIVGVGAAIADGQLLMGAGLREGEVATIDGDSGEIFSGDVSKRASRLTAFEQTLRQWAVDIQVQRTGADDETQR